MEEVDLFFGENFYVFGDEVPYIVTYFCLGLYFFIYVEFLLCCIVEEVLIERSFFVFIVFNNVW